MPTYYVENFGCRATQADGASLEHQFERHGLSRAQTSAHADLVVINSCTVTAAADQDARAAIRRIQRHNRNAKIVVTGCYAQRAHEEVAALPGVACVIGNSHKHQLAEIALPLLLPPHHVPRIDDSYSPKREQYHALPRQHEREGHDLSRAISPLSISALAAEVHRQSSTPALLPISVLTENRELRTENSIFVSDIFAHTELLAAPVFDASNQRTRPNLKIQDGCDNRCSFCVIPYVRGQSRSLPLQKILEEVKTLVAAGYREVVISGINLGRWGRDLSERLPSPGFRKPEAESRKPHFEHLIRAILAETQLEKLRISSVEPMDWTDDLISLVTHSPRIAKHAHVPLQSGSDAVLRRMHRKYRPWHYREKIEKIRAAMPTAAIGADVMVGFPGETDADFESTRTLIEDLPFTYLHVFTYSARPGTPAAMMPNQIPIHLARERNRILRNLAAEKKQAFMRTFIGQTVEAITLSSHEDEPCGADTLVREATTTDQCGAGAPASVPASTEALTDNFLKLRLKGSHQPNRWFRVQVQDVANGSLVGVVVAPTTANLDALQ